MERRSGGVGRVAALVAASVALIVVAVVAFSVGRLSTLAEPTPADTSAEAGFARDMQVHHQQGVELAMIVRDRSDDPDIRLLAYDIATTQAQQAGQLYGWLRTWGLFNSAALSIGESLGAAVALAITALVSSAIVGGAFTAEFAVTVAIAVVAVVLAPRVRPRGEASVM